MMLLEEGLFVFEGAVITKEETWLLFLQGYQIIRFSVVYCFITEWHMTWKNLYSI